MLSRFLDTQRLRNWISRGRQALRVIAFALLTSASELVVHKFLYYFFSNPNTVTTPSIPPTQTTMPPMPKMIPNLPVVSANQYATALTVVRKIQMQGLQGAPTFQLFPRPATEQTKLRDSQEKRVCRHT